MAAKLPPNLTSNRMREFAASGSPTGLSGSNPICEVALPIHRTALEWLQAGREGVVFLAPERAVIELRDFGPFVVEDVEHGRELRHLFRSREPQIFLPKMRAAA